MSTEESTIEVASILQTAQYMVKRMDNQTMFRVPIWLYQGDPDAYTPQYVSIGPLHHVDLQTSSGSTTSSRIDPHQRINLLAMEGHKQVFMLRLLENIVPDEIQLTMGSCLEFLSTNIGRLERCYGNEINSSSYELLKKIMLVDCCFLLQVFLLSDFGGRFVNALPNSDAIQRSIDRDRGVYGATVSAVQHDLVLLENQIPGFVLEGLSSIIFRGHNNHLKFTDLVMGIFPEIVLPSEQEQTNIVVHSHLLATVYQKCTALPPDDEPEPPRQQRSPSTNARGIRFSCATKLCDAGVIFLPNYGNKSFLDIQFDEKRLKIPILVLNDDTVTLLKNLLAYEHVCSSKSEKLLASYVMFMDHLIDSKEDLQMLEKQGIIVNELGGRQDASNVFNKISKNNVIRVKEFYFQELCERIESHCESRWNMYAQDFKRRHLNTPWRMISLLAAAILLLLTFTQTMFAAFSYHVQADQGHI